VRLIIAILTGILLISAGIYMDQVTGQVSDLSLSGSTTGNGSAIVWGSRNNISTLSLIGRGYYKGLETGRLNSLPGEPKKGLVFPCQLASSYNKETNNSNSNDSASPSGFRGCLIHPDFY
jgi:hypothetical protein